MRDTTNPSGCVGHPPYTDLVRYLQQVSIKMDQDAQGAPEAPLKGSQVRHDQPQRVCGTPAIH